MQDLLPAAALLRRTHKRLNALLKTSKHSCLRRKIHMDLELHDISIADASNMMYSVNVLLLSSY